MQSRLLFIAGMPHSGKTHFCDWLRDTHGFLHIDAEVHDSLGAHGVRGVWDACFVAQDWSGFAVALRKLGRPIAFNWGFPLHLLNVARSLKATGLECWWFDADESRARREYRVSGKAAENFGPQAAAIAEHRGELMELFRPNVIITLDGAGNRLSPADTWKKIAAAGR